MDTVGREEMRHGTSYWHTKHTGSELRPSRRPTPRRRRTRPYLVPFPSDGLTAGQKCFTGVSDQTTEQLAYESALNTYATRHLRSVWCLYDLGALRTDMVVDVVRTHPKVLISGVVLESPY